EMRVAPDEAPCELSGVRVDEQLVRIEAQSALGLVWTMHPIPVELSRGNVVEVHVPDVLGALGQDDALDLAATVAVKQAKLDPTGLGGTRRKSRPAPAQGGPRGVCRPGQNPNAPARE